MHDTALTIGLISLFPDMFDAMQHSVIGKALDKGIVNLQHWNPRDYTGDKHKTVDDKPYGGGPGMVMMAEPLLKSIHHAKSQLEPNVQTVYLSPQGKPLKQSHLIEFIANKKNLLLICGRYEGIDERVIESTIDQEWSIGDFVLSGGEIAAMAVIDAITRLLPGTLGDSDSAEQDSFMNGLLDHPHYTRPETINGMRVPSVLLSGNHEEIKNWRLKQSIGKTWLKRPDLLENRPLTQQEEDLLQQFKNELIGVHHD